ncbi:MAG TPA: exodeoxyribonuclease VII large subunit [Candidatus Dormibacteraeota bacterium]|nr:exodeoxyribonuclease VII large subunit [Candidatus Dormibacteraeota bacterium]
MQPPTDQVIGVKDFIEILNETLSFAFPAVTVEGEVSGYKLNQGKWVFFDLKDDDATLPCFAVQYQMKMPIEDGMKVRVTGVPKLTKWGKFSFTVKSISLAGEGELKRAFELLKQKLSAEGLFAEDRKRTLDPFPRAIGLITSQQSEAYKDFITRLNERWGGITVQVADVQVQGAPAPDQIVAAIEYFNQMPSPPDALVIIRGGGSLEDLQAFNTEPVARAIAGSRTPTVVGVGHEGDVSLADFAADKRASTPTHAAQLAVPDRREVGQKVNHQVYQMSRCLEKAIEWQRVGLHRFMSHFERFLHRPKNQVQFLQSQLASRQQQLVSSHQQKLQAYKRLLASFDPKATLARGYAIARRGQQVITDPAQVQTGDGLVIQLAKGEVNTKVKE